MRVIATPVNKSFPDIFVVLPIFALCIDLFTPFLIWKGVLPAAVRWGSHAAIAIMIMVSVLRMLNFNHIPRFVWLMAVIALIWSYVAIGQGQGVPSTIWGLWLLFQFPIAYLFIYLQPNIPEQIPIYIRKYGLMLLGIEVIVQLMQYVAGETPGDQLAGLFGANGTGNAVIFEILICCICLGHWITSKRWFGVVLALVLSGLSSVLGEMKLFPIAILLIGIIAVFIYALRNRSLIKFFVYLGLIVTVSVGFALLYNIIIPSASNTPLQTYITNPSNLYQYLTRTESYYKGEGVIYTDIGRATAVEIGWNSLQKDPITFLFGYGIGSRSESRTLGTAGVALASGGLGISVGTSLLVVMQEMGLIGLVMLGSIYIGIILSLVRDIRRNQSSIALELRYALLLFSCLWPVYLFYATVLLMRVPMLLYWLLLGYVFAESRASRINALDVSRLS